MYEQFTKDFRDKYWGRVNVGSPDECWEWGAGKNGYGRGVMWLGRKAIYAHRVALMLKLGRDILPGKNACHHCDNASCVNPDHVYEGSQLDNMRDCRERERNPKGVRNGMAKLTDDDIRSIRQLRKGRSTLFEIADLYGISFGQVGRIVRGELWTHVK